MAGELQCVLKTEACIPLYLLRHVCRDWAGPPETPSGGGDRSEQPWTLEAAAWKVNGTAKRKAKEGAAICHKGAKSHPPGPGPSRAEQKTGEFSGLLGSQRPGLLA